MSLQLLTLQQPQQPKPLFGEQKSTLPTETDDLFKAGMTTNPIVLKQDNPVDDKRYSAIYGTKVTVLPGYLTGTASMPRGSTSDKRALLKKSSEFRKKPFVNWREGGRISKKTPITVKEKGLQAIVAKVPNLFKQNPNLVTSIDPAIHQPGVIDRILGRVVRAVLDI